MKNDKKAINYYSSFYEVSKELTVQQFYDFNMAIYECHFSKEDTIQKVNDIVFNDDFLNKIWNVVKEQVKRHDRSSKNYRHWKKEVFKRDNNTCIKCKSNKKIEAHHIIRWVDSISLRYEVSNGATLCSKCHKKEHRKLL